MADLDLDRDELGSCEWCGAERLGDYEYQGALVCAHCEHGAELVDDQDAHEPSRAY